LVKTILQGGPFQRGQDIGDNSDHRAHRLLAAFAQLAQSHGGLDRACPGAEIRGENFRAGDFSQVNFDVGGLYRMHRTVIAAISNRCWPGNSWQERITRATPKFQVRCAGGAHTAW